MLKIRRYVHFYLAVILLITGSFSIQYFSKSYKGKVKDNQQLQLRNAHNNAKNVLKSSIEKYAAIVSGVQAYAVYSEEFPTATQIQEFINFQLDQINSEGAYVLSFLDTTHVFQYSLSNNNVDPGILTGMNVNSLRGQDEIDRLNRLLSSDSIQMFYPINLVEGWLGIPLNFRVQRNGENLGYFAPIFQLEDILDKIYFDPVLSNFVFKFSTEKGEFDRVAAYDGSEIYNDEKDIEYYKNFDIDDSEFIYSDISLLGNKIKIGTAYRFTPPPVIVFNQVLLGWTISFWIFILVITWQIERYKRVNYKLKKLDKTKNRFFSIISHDLKGPLNSLTSFSGLLINHTGSMSTKEIQMLAKDIEKSLKNLFALLENLLEWARSQMGQIEYVIEEFNMEALVSKNIELLEAQAKEKLIKMENKVPKSLILNAHHNSIDTVVRNLLSNALKFTENGGEIVISASTKESQYVFKISDNGVGMSKKVANSLFKLDSKQSALGTNEEKGTGLGLILCKEFIEKNGGKIWVESKEGNGSTFYFTIPK